MQCIRNNDDLSSLVGDHVPMKNGEIVQENWMAKVGDMTISSIFQGKHCVLLFNGVYYIPCWQLRARRA